MPSTLVFKIDSPPLTGGQIRTFQIELNRRYAEWDVAKRIGEDGVYGDETRRATRQVCKGLGILHEAAMRNGVTPRLRAKISDPDRRTDTEKARSRSAAAKAYRAALRKRFEATSEGTATFDGKTVAAWIVPSLQWAREHGWTGGLTSGHRTCERQKVVAAEFAASLGKTVAEVYPNGPCASNHVSVNHPGGAVDVTQHAQLREVLRDSPVRPRLVWAGSGDPVHFSATGR